MHMDPGIPLLIGAAFVIVLIALVLQKFKQPFVVAYMIAGIILGPQIMSLIPDTDLLHRLGAFGVLFLLFFVGMEVSLPHLVQNWKIVVIGTFLQVLISVLCIWGLGFWLSWPFPRVLLLGFVISLSSTAVIIKMLNDWGEQDSFVGQNVIGILLVQDIIIVPMMISINLLSGQQLNMTEITLQAIGALLIFGVISWIFIKKEFSLPFAKLIKKDHELQIFSALLICLACSFITGFLGLSAALGAFVGGIIVAAAKETDWIQKNLEPFKGIFVALFFVSIGMSVDLSFIRVEWPIIALLVLTAFLTNTLINVGILILLKVKRKEALYAGALLSQIGEFSFVLAAVGFQAGIINQYGYQATITTIFLSLLLSPLWISLVKNLTSSTKIKI